MKPDRGASPIDQRPWSSANAQDGRRHQNASGAPLQPRPMDAGVHKVRGGGGRAGTSWSAKTHSAGKTGRRTRCYTRSQSADSRPLRTANGSRSIRSRIPDAVGLERFRWGAEPSITLPRTRARPAPRLPAPKPPRRAGSERFRWSTVPPIALWPRPRRPGPATRRHFARCADTTSPPQRSRNWSRGSPLGRRATSAASAPAPGCTAPADPQANLQLQQPRPRRTSCAT